MRRIEDQVRWPAAEIVRANVDVKNRRAGVPVWSLPAMGLVAVAAWWMLSPGKRDTITSQPVVSTITLPEQLTPHPATSTKASPDENTQVTATQRRTPATSPAPVAVPDKQSKPTNVPQPAKPAPSFASTDANPLPDDLEQTLVGEWSGYYQGERQLKVAADGTGTMTAEPEGLAATLLAPKLTFQIKWKRNKDAFEFETVGGEPLDKVNVVVRMYGRNRRHKIVTIEANQIVLLDEDGVTKYVWKRKRVEKKSAPDSK